MAEARWIDLEGAANVRDVGGLPTYDGGAISPGRLIRADNLQGLTASDVRTLVDGHGVRAVADLRTTVEAVAEGPGPMTREPLVSVRQFSLYREEPVGSPAVGSEPSVLPWRDRDLPRVAEVGDVFTAVFLGYLEERADSVLGALRLISSTSGATVVHCAAGKDRTGVVTAIALAEAGVVLDAIVEDYVRSAERLREIHTRLHRRAMYADLPAVDEWVVLRPRAESLLQMFAAIDESHGGVRRWLRSHGWTQGDRATLRRSLLGGAVPLPRLAEAAG